MTTAQGPSGWDITFKPTTGLLPTGSEPIINTKFSRIIGKPPLMVAGMTPTTSFYGLNLVAACANAGYHVELAGGGLSRPAFFKERIATLLTKLKPGAGIALNLLSLITIYIDDHHTARRLKKPLFSTLDGSNLQSNLRVCMGNIIT